MINITPAGRAMRVTEEEVDAEIAYLQEEVFGAGRQPTHADLDHVLHTNDHFKVYDESYNQLSSSRTKQLVREAVEHLRSQLPPRN